MKQWDEEELHRRLSALMSTVHDCNSSPTSEPPPAPPLAAPPAPPLDDVIPVAPPLLSSPILVSIGTQTDAVVEDNNNVAPSAPPLAPPLSDLSSSDIPCAPPMFDAPPTAPPLDIPCAPPLFASSADVVIGSDAPPPPPPPDLTSIPSAPPAPTAASGGRNDIMAAIRAAKAKNNSSASSSSSGDPRADLLAAIKAGPRLRKVGADEQPTDSDTPPPPPASTVAAVSNDPRAELLAAIRGAKLRKSGTAAASGEGEAVPPAAPPLAAPAQAASTPSSGDPRSDLLKAITGGVKLRKVDNGSTSTAGPTSDVPQPPPAPPALAASTDPRSDLLKAIQSGIKLRKVAAAPAGDETEAAASAPPPPPPPPSFSSPTSTVVSGADPRDELLQAIRGGIKLRKTPTAAEAIPNRASSTRAGSLSRSVTVSSSPSHQSRPSTSTIPTAPSPTSLTSTSTSGSRTSSVDSPSRNSSSGGAPYDLQSALSSAMFRRKSRMQYDTMRTLTSPLSSSLSSSPTHQPSRRLTSINDAFDGEEGETTIQLEAAPMPHADGTVDDIPTAPPLPPPPPPGPPSSQPAVKPVRFVSPKPSASSPSIGPREELLAAIRDGARLKSVSAAPTGQWLRSTVCRSGCQA